MDYWRQSLLWTFHSWDILRTLFPPPTQSTQDWRVAEFRDYKTAWKWVQRTIEQKNHTLLTSSLPKSAGMIQETNGVCGEPRSIIGVRWSDPRGFARQGCRRKWTLEISYKCDSFHDIFVIVVWPFYPIFLPLPLFFFLTLFAEWIINDSFPKQQTDRQRNKRTNNPTNGTHISLSLWMSFIWTLKILWPN